MGNFPEFSRNSRQLLTIDVLVQKKQHASKRDIGIATVTLGRYLRANWMDGFHEKEELIF